MLKDLNKIRNKEKNNIQADLIENALSDFKIKSEACLKMRLDMNNQLK